MKRRPQARVLLLAAVVAVLAGAGAWTAGLLDGLERGTVKARFGLRREARPSDVAVVAIDDATFSDLHRQWPFPRSLHARAIDRLHAAGAREIVYDVQFTEPTTPKDDMALYDAIGRAGGAVMATSESDSHGRTDVLGGDQNLAAIHAKAAASNLTNDPGGSISRFPYQVGKLRSLAVVAAERATGRALPAGAFDHRKAYIDYRGAPGTFPTLHFSDVVQGRFDRSAVRGKIVVIGASAPTLQDVHSTPIGGSELMAGPEVQANAIWTALHGLPLRDAPGYVAVVMLVLLGLAPALVRLRLGVLKAVGVSVLLALAYCVVAQVAFDGGTILSVAAPLVGLALGTAAMVVASHLVESRERRRVAHDNEVLEEHVRERTEELRETQLEIIHRLGAAVESRDAETGAHIQRISILCRELALAIGIDRAQAELIGHASAMHDIGKIGIPDDVLLKPAKLDPREWELMQTHTTTGAGILGGSQSPLMKMAEAIALTHHERWDGSGYPFGLKGEHIPLEGRICAICDVFDALVSKRPYKDAFSVSEAIAEIRHERGRHFDPEIVDAFLALPDDLLSPPPAAEPDEITISPQDIRISAPSR